VVFSPSLFPITVLLTAAALRPPLFITLILFPLSNPVHPLSSKASISFAASHYGRPHTMRTDPCSSEDSISFKASFALSWIAFATALVRLGGCFIHSRNPRRPNPRDFQSRQFWLCLLDRATFRSYSFTPLRKESLWNKVSSMDSHYLSCDCLRDSCSSYDYYYFNIHVIHVLSP
jgi:hypothetical protein